MGSCCSNSHDTSEHQGVDHIFADRSTPTVQFTNRDDNAEGGDNEEDDQATFDNVAVPSSMLVGAEEDNDDDAWELVPPPKIPEERVESDFSSLQQDNHENRKNPPLTGILAAPPLPRDKQRPLDAPSDQHQQQQQHRQFKTLSLSPLAEDSNLVHEGSCSGSSSSNNNTPNHRNSNHFSPRILQFPIVAAVGDQPTTTTGAPSTMIHIRASPPPASENPLQRHPSRRSQEDLSGEAGDSSSFDDDTHRRKSSTGSTFKLMALLSGSGAVGGGSTATSQNDPFVALLNNSDSSRGFGGMMGSNSTAPPSPVGLNGANLIHGYSRLKTRSSNSAFYRHYVGKLTATDPASQHRKLPLTPAERRVRQRAEVQAFEVHEVPTTLGLGLAWPCPHLAEENLSTTTPSQTSPSATILPFNVSRRAVDGAAEGQPTNTSTGNENQTGFAAANVPQDCVTLSGLEDQVVASSSGRGNHLQRSTLEKRRTLERCLACVTQLMKTVTPFSEQGCVLLLQIDSMARSTGLEKVCSVTIAIEAMIQDLFFLQADANNCVTMIHRGCASHLEKEYLEDFNFPIDHVLNLTEENEFQQYVQYLAYRFRSDIDYALIVLVLLICQGLGRVPWAAPPPLHS